MEKFSQLTNFARLTYAPILREDSREMLCEALARVQPDRILEIGTSIGYSGIVMLRSALQARLTTLELNHCRYAQALSHFERYGCAGRARVLCIDAAEYLQSTSDVFDFIFLDGPKAQYATYLSYLYERLETGGILFADNLRFDGRVDTARKNGLGAIPRKHRAAVKSIIAYCDAVSTARFRTEFYESGDGIAVSEKL